eukprot:CAMPEP_0115520298 /NCGR_PEP_ID=MMETSP0271-20121206/78905_1 /TAXON_ID=71861 /ORGANISM="Scrippsiella trochoidea, Strain CCMP3099" /LENGTH=40 /DNA_ID= /DNA_START= /DNA_END= /DNA_ORIENTATION=
MAGQELWRALPKLPANLLHWQETAAAHHIAAATPEGRLVA